MSSANQGGLGSIAFLIFWIGAFTIVALMFLFPQVIAYFEPVETTPGGLPMMPVDGPAPSRVPAWLSSPMMCVMVSGLLLAATIVGAGWWVLQADDEDPHSV